MTQAQQPEALIAEYRKTMDKEVLHCWAKDACTAMGLLHACVQELEAENQRLLNSWKAQRLISDRAIALGKKLESQLAQARQEHEPLTPASASYRMLRAGVDIIEADDEYLSDDTTTWERVGACIFVGMTHLPAMKPGRRRVREGETPCT